MQNISDSPQSPHRLSGPFVFPDLNEFAFALFERWICGGELHGPHDFHSMHHYLGLYVLAGLFEIESLQNHAMDLIREYYKEDNMTAPPFRLEYIYQSTGGSCLMRDFLTSTAAYRCLADAEHGVVLSESLKGVLKKGGELPADFAQSLCTLFANEREDPRRGDPCRWHEHETTKPCQKWEGLEPWESA